MYVGQTAARILQYPQTTATQNKDKNQMVDVLNAQAKGQPTLEEIRAKFSQLSDKITAHYDPKMEKLSLEEIRAKFSQLSDKITAHYDPKMEKLLEGYKKLAQNCKTSREELDFQQGQMDQFSALSSAYDSTQTALTDAQARYQASVEEYGDLSGADASSPQAQQQRALAETVSELQKSLSDVDAQLNGIIQRSNQHDGFANQEQAPYGKQTDDGDQYTRENFAERIQGKVEDSREKVDASVQALNDYCERHGLTAYDFEMYLMQKANLNAAMSVVKQDLLTMLREEGADDGREIDTLA